MRAGTSASRPWGSVDWVLGRLPKRSWSLLGCHGAEERSLAIWELLRSSALNNKSMLVKVEPISRRYANEYAERMKLRNDKLQQIGNPTEPITSIGLFASDADIVRIADEFASISGPHLIIDFSCFPKRIFFPFIKRLLAKESIETLLGTYTLPESYSSGLLAEDHQAFAHLPLFGPSRFPEDKIEMVIVIAGFMKLGLAELLEPYKTGVAIRTILPFPPGLPGYHRNWEFIREMQKTLPSGVPPPIRVEAYDCGDVFDHFRHLTECGTRNAIFAPFGPKPLSLATCLFAALSGQPVYYTQPTIYNPDYSLGIRAWNRKLGSYGYVLRVNGKDIYSLS